MNHMPETAWRRSTKYGVVVGLVLFGLFILTISGTVLPLLVIAGLLAFSVRPVIKLLNERLRLPRGIAVGLTYLTVLLLLPLAALIILSAIAQALSFVFGIDYEAVINSGIGAVRGWMEDLKAWQVPFGPLDGYLDALADAVLNALSGASALPQQPVIPPLSDLASQLGAALSVTFGAVAGLVGDIFSSAILFIFVFLSSIYFTLSAARYRDLMLNAVPASYQPEIRALVQRIGQVWVSFFRGQITLMLIIGVIVWVGLTILGVPGALSLAIIAGLLEVVPNLGPIVATIPAVVVALLQGSTYLPVNNFVMGLIVIGFYIVVQQLENSLIVPRVLGEAVELPPLIVMSGVLIGGSVAGILGALLATPVIATGREVLAYLYAKLIEPSVPMTSPVVAPAEIAPAPPAAAPVEAPPVEAPPTASVAAPVKTPPSPSA